MQHNPLPDIDNLFFIFAPLRLLVTMRPDWLVILAGIRNNAATNMWETIFRYHGIDWIALALNSASIYLLGKKRKAGFSLGIVANIAWIVFAILAHSVATLVACTIFILLNVKGWWNWTHEETSFSQER